MLKELTSEINAFSSVSDVMFRLSECIADAVGADLWNLYLVDELNPFRIVKYQFLSQESTSNKYKHERGKSSRGKSTF